MHKNLFRKREKTKIPKYLKITPSEKAVEFVRIDDE